MSGRSLTQLFATDKEIYDLIMSSPKRMSEAVLLDILAKRGIICSVSSSRESLASLLSTLPHDYNDIAELVQKGEHGKRAERTTCYLIDSELKPQEIKDAVLKYQKDANMSERISVSTSSAVSTKVKLDYEEIDYSRTRLIQRQRRQADFDFRVVDGKTRIRLPATAKAKAVAGELRDKIESERKTPLPFDEVSVADLNSPELRNAFFTRLIRHFPEFKLQMVTDAKVARWTVAEVDEEDAEEDVEEARREILNQIESVSMRGTNIVLTEHYQKLLEQGFFVTSISWRSEYQKEPYYLVQFEVAFEDGHAGTGFRYAARQSEKKDVGYSTAFTAVPDNRKPGLFRLIEEAARDILAIMRTEMASK